jgi:predicted transcriptional regulator
LFSVFGAETDQNEAYLFDLLKRGYVDARCRSDYTITDEELSILIKRVDFMMAIAESICKSKIASFDIL